MGRDDRREGQSRGDRVTRTEERENEEAEVFTVDDTLDRVRRLASDTAELLIVTEGGAEVVLQAEHTRLYLEALRHRVDTGEYALLPRTVAEAMVRRADRLKKE
jgi:hypothetical protein